MINKVKDSFNTGLMRVKWIATLVAERTKAETSVVKLLYESSKLESKIDDLYRDIGKRVIELKEKGEKEVYQDFIVQQALNELKDLREAVKDYGKQAKNINKLPE
jgi:gas vesicle protein